MEEINKFYSKIVGSTFVTNGQQLLSQLKSGDKLLLEREPENPYDANAIRVLNSDRKKLGFIPKGTAVELSKQMDNPDMTVQATVSEITGAGKDNCGCNILIQIFKKDKQDPDFDATEVDIY